LHNRVAMTPSGTKVDITLIRNEKQQELTAQVEEQPSNIASSMAPASQKPQLLQKMGLSLQDLTSDLAHQFNYKIEQGVLVAGVDPGSPAAFAGIQVGSLIEEVNRQQVHNLKELQQVLQKNSDAKDVLLLIHSGNRSQYVVLGIQ
jgi:serine protease Do